MDRTRGLKPAERRVAVGVVVAALLAAGLVGPRGADAADPPTPVVYVAFSHNFPDALTGSVAAALDCAPLLLVPKDPPLPEATKAELQRLQPGRIVILGGEAVVSTAMEDELGNYTTPADNVDRLAGDDRFGTAADISQALAERACDADTLDGLDSAAFWQKSEAVDADTLDGLDSTDFARRVIGIASSQGATNGALVPLVLPFPFTDVPDASVTLNLPPPPSLHGWRIVAHFTAESACIGDGDADLAHCAVRLLLDGNEMDPQVGEDFVFDSEQAGARDLEAHAVIRTDLILEGGTHTVEVQRALLDDTGFVWLDDWTLYVEAELVPAI